MKVAVFYNDDAGSNVAAREIQRTIERHGHRVVNLVETEDGVQRLFDRPADLIVAAGGDGTVASAARVVARTGIPLAVLPLGTANNIARSLGWDAPLDQVIAAWASLRPVITDLGVATGTWGDWRFVEGVGGGLVARSIAAVDAAQLAAEATPEGRIHRAVGGYLDVLTSLEPRPWSLTLDGARLDGEFLLVEVLNIPSIGPNVVLAAGADLSDGAFTVVLAGEQDRAQLLDYWRARLEGEAPALSLDTRHASEVRLDRGDMLHVDDMLFPGPDAGRVRLWVEHGAIAVLRGPFGHRLDRTSQNRRATPVP